MGQDLFERSSGKLTLQIYPSQQLGAERECLELLQIGSMDMTKVSVGVFENIASKITTDFIGFIGYYRYCNVIDRCIYVYVMGIVL